MAKKVYNKAAHGEAGTRKSYRNNEDSNNKKAAAPDWQWLPIEKYVDGKLQTVYVKARKVGYPQSRWEAVEYDANGNYRVYADASDARNVQRWIVNNQQTRITSNPTIASTSTRGKRPKASSNQVNTSIPSVKTNTTSTNVEPVTPSLINEGVNIDIPTVEDYVPKGWHESAGVLFPDSYTPNEEDELLNLHYNPKNVGEYRYKKEHWYDRVPTHGGGFTTQGYLYENPDAYKFEGDDPSVLGLKDPLFWALTGGAAASNGALRGTWQAGKSAFNYGKDKLISGIGEDAWASNIADLKNIWSVAKYPVNTGFGILGASNLASDHGLRRTWDLGRKTFTEDWRYMFPLLGSAFGDTLDATFMIPSTKLYGNLYRNLGNKAIDTGLSTLGQLSNKYGNNTLRNYAASALTSRAINEGAKALETFEPLDLTTGVTRTKLGDVEINDPSLSYRQGDAAMGADFLDTGIVREKGSYKNPMFYQGDLFYQSPLERPGLLRKEQGRRPGKVLLTKQKDLSPKSDLLVSNGEMSVANQYSNPKSGLYNIVSEDGTILGKGTYGERRRVPAYEGAANSSNTTLYRWEPGYGYRKAEVGDGKTFTLGNEVVDENGNLTVSVEDLVNQIREKYPYTHNPAELSNKGYKGTTNLIQHIEDVVKSAQEYPLPEGVSRKDFVTSALYHDFGKLWGNYGHGTNSNIVVNTMGWPTTDSIISAVGEHMNPQSFFDSATPFSKALHAADVGRGRPFEELVAKYPYLDYTQTSVEPITNFSETIARQNAEAMRARAAAQEAGEAVQGTTQVSTSTPLYSSLFPMGNMTDGASKGLIDMANEWTKNLAGTVRRMSSSFANKMGTVKYSNGKLTVKGTGNSEGRFGKLIGSGSEQTVFEDATDPNKVLKVYGDGTLYGMEDMKNGVASILERNKIPGQAPVEFVGYMQDGHSMYPVYSQVKVSPLDNMPITEFEETIMPKIEKVMASNGYKKVPGTTDQFTNGEIVVADIGPDNVGITADGKMVLIDAHTVPAYEYDLPEDFINELNKDNNISNISSLSISSMDDSISTPGKLSTEEALKKYNDEWDYTTERAQKFINEDVIPRLRDQGHTIDEYTAKYKKYDPNDEFDVLTDAGNSGNYGSYFPMSDDVTINLESMAEDYHKTSVPTLFENKVHEGAGHGVRFSLSPDYNPPSRQQILDVYHGRLTSEELEKAGYGFTDNAVFSDHEKKILTDAYEDFVSKTRIPDDSRMDEIGAINTQMRSTFSNNANILYKELDKVLDNASSGDVIYRLLRNPYTAGRTKRYLKGFLHCNTETIMNMNSEGLSTVAKEYPEIEDKISKVKLALKIGGYAIPVGAAGTAYGISQSNNKNGNSHAYGGPLMRMANKFGDGGPNKKFLDVINPIYHNNMSTITIGNDKIPIDELLDIDRDNNRIKVRYHNKAGNPIDEWIVPAENFWNVADTVYDEVDAISKGTHNAVRNLSNVVQGAPTGQSHIHTTGGAGYIPEAGPSLPELLYQKTSTLDPYDISVFIKNLTSNDRYNRTEDNVNAYMEQIAEEAADSVKLDDDYLQHAFRGLKDAKTADELYAIYLGIPEFARRYNRRLKESPYKKGAFALPLDNYTKQLIIEDTQGLKHGTGINTDMFSSMGLDTSSIGRNVDDRGEYAAYWDSVDLNPFKGKFALKEIPYISDIEDLSFGLFKSVPVYDMIYLDDYYEVPQPTHATYLPEVIKWGHANGGPLMRLANRFDDGGDVVPEPNVPTNGTAPDMSWHNWWLNNRASTLGQNVLDTQSDWEKEKNGTLGVEELGKNEAAKQIENASKFTEYIGPNLPEDVYTQLHEYYPGKTDAQVYKNITKNAGAATLGHLGAVLYPEVPSLSTSTHERTHTLGGKQTLPQEWKIADILDSNPKIYRKPAFLMPASSFSDAYWDNPKEIYARLMAFRQEHNLDPIREVTQDDLDNWRKAGWGKSEGAPFLLDRYKDDILLRFFNEVANNNTIETLDSNNANYTAYGGPLVQTANMFKKGGPKKSYAEWKRRISTKKGIRFDNTYDYRGYYSKYPEEAWAMTEGDKDAHFPDEFKTAYHPTFSTESIYDGVYHPVFNPHALHGGTWNGDKFIMSEDGYKGPVSMDERLGYFQNMENNGVSLREYDGTWPVYDGVPLAGVLPNVEVIGKLGAHYEPTDAIQAPVKYDENYAEGGQLQTPKKWNDLSVKEKADMMKVAIKNGITDLSAIRDKYNEFAEGGYIESSDKNLYSGGSWLERGNNNLLDINRSFANSTAGKNLQNTFNNIDTSIVKNREILNNTEFRNPYNPSITYSSGSLGAGSKNAIQYAINFFVNKGLERHQAIGLVANLMRESSLNPGAVNKSSGAFGLAQLLGNRKSKYFSMYGNNPNSFQNQLEYIWWELNNTHKTGLARLKASKTVDEAAANAFGYYEFSAGIDGAVKAMNASGQNGQRALNTGINYARQFAGLPVLKDAEYPYYLEGNGINGFQYDAMKANEGDNTDVFNPMYEEMLLKNQEQMNENALAIADMKSMIDAYDKQKQQEQQAALEAQDQLSQARNQMVVNNIINAYKQGQKGNKDILGLISPLFNFAAQGGKLNNVYDLGGDVTLGLDPNTYLRRQPTSIVIPNASDYYKGNTYVGNTKIKGGAGKSIPSNHEFYKILPQLFAKDGVNITIFSGYRPNAITTEGRRSRHSIEGGAADIGPAKGSTFADIRRVLDDPTSNVSRYLISHGYGYLDETSATGTTKYWHDHNRDHSHYHIGQDYAKKYYDLMGGNSNIYTNSPYNPIIDSPIKTPMEEDYFNQQQIIDQQNYDIAALNAQWKSLMDQENAARQAAIDAKKQQENDDQLTFGKELALGILNSMGNKGKRSSNLMSTIVTPIINNALNRNLNTNLAAYGGNLYDGETNPTGQMTTAKPVYTNKLKQRPNGVYYYEDDYGNKWPVLQIADNKFAVFNTDGKISSILDTSSEAVEAVKPSWAYGNLTPQQEYAKDLAKTTVKYLDKDFANMLTFGTIGQNEHGVNTLRNADSWEDYVKGTLDVLSPAMLGSGPIGNIYRGAFGTYGLYEDVPQIINDFSNGDYWRGAFDLGKTALDATLAYSGGKGVYSDALWGMNNYGNTAMRTYARPRIVANAIAGDVNEVGKPLMSWEEAVTEDANMARRELGKESIEYEPIEGINRTKVGDVEIDNPALAYRQGKNIAQDFVDSGKVAVKRIPEEEKYMDKEVPKRADGHPVFTPEDFSIKRKSFPNPMFSQGQLWYGLPTEAGNDLLVTAEPLAIGTQHANRVESGLNGTFDLRSGYGKSGRRVPLHEEQLNASNTTVYTWEPGYGYRKVAQEPSTIDWEDAVNLKSNYAQQIAKQNAEAMRANMTEEKTPSVTQPITSKNISESAITNDNSTDVFDVRIDREALAKLREQERANRRKEVENNLSETIIKLQKFINHDIIPRLQEQGHTIKEYSPSIRVNNKDAYDEALKSKSEAYFDSVTGETTINAERAKTDLFRLLSHEEGSHGIRAKMDPSYDPLDRETVLKILKGESANGEYEFNGMVFNNYETKTLQEAYPWVNRKVKNQGDINHVTAEQSGINTEIRAAFTDNGTTFEREKVDRNMDAAPDGKFLRLLLDHVYTKSIALDLSEATGIESLPKIRGMNIEELTELSNKYPAVKEIVNKVRNATKTVGMYALPIAGAGTAYGLSNNDEIQ